jgi:hypothetical protein
VELMANHITGTIPMEIVPAPRERAWMEHTPGANRCLPLRMANAAGWWVLNPATLIAEWTGEAHELGVRVFDEAGNRPPYVATNFGHGVLTFLASYLFRTEPGWNLLIRGPANLIKHGIQPLEGLVEADWSIATFTMNWKFTFPHVPVRFEAGEPLYQIVPLRRGDLESFEPRVEPLEGLLLERYGRWIGVRATHSQPANTLNVEEALRVQREWRGAYARGRFPDEEEKFEGHQTRLKLKPFGKGA